MRRVGIVVLAGALFLLLAAGAVQANPTVNRGQSAPVKLFAALACDPGGGASVTFTVRNVGKRTLAIENDFHLALVRVRPGGRELVSQVFVFPAREFQVIAPGGQKTFLVPMGTGEGGEPGIDLSARRLILEAEVFFEGRREPARRHFSFPGCNP